jgi:APA family basic amino acid/polyamine antiporter
VIILRIKRPDLRRPYRTPGYPAVPILFVLVAGVFIVSTLWDSPRESLMGIALILLGLPFYAYWSRRLHSEATAGTAGGEMEPPS